MLVRVNGVELEFVDEGSGVPVVFSHGGSSDVRYWDPQRATFARQYRFIAYSHRFHGAGSWAPDSDDTAEAHADDLIAIIKKLGEPAHVVGFSTAIALRATLRDPGLIRSLTVIEPNVPWLLEDDAEGESILAWWRGENDRVRAEAGDDEERRARLWFELVNNQGPATFDAQPKAMQQMWLDNFGSRRSVIPPSPLTCEHLASIGVPLLVLGSEFGMPYSRGILARLAACIPGSRLQVIPGVTHFMSYQAPDAFNSVVLGFLAEH